MLYIPDLCLQQSSSSSWCRSWNSPGCRTGNWEGESGAHRGQVADGDAERAVVCQHCWSERSWHSAGTCFHHTAARSWGNRTRNHVSHFFFLQKYLLKSPTETSEKVYVPHLSLELKVFKEELFVIIWTTYQNLEGMEENITNRLLVMGSYHIKKGYTVYFYGLSCRQSLQIFLNSIPAVIGF